MSLSVFVLLRLCVRRPLVGDLLAADGDALLDADELPDELVEEATEMLSRETRPLTSNSSVTWSWLDQYVVSATTVGGRKVVGR